MAMTMTQKILAAHAGLDEVKAGQLIMADLDLVLGNDVTTPVAINEFRRYYGDLPVTYIASYEELIQRSDSLVITTAWPEFRNIRERTQKKVIDCRYML